MGVERYRQRFNFWLDTTKHDEYELAEAIDELKEKRQFMKTLRQAFALILSLRSHDTSVLQSLFPWVAEEFAAQTGQVEHLERLEALAQQFQTMMIAPQSERVTPLLHQSRMTDDADALRNKPTVSFDAEAAKQRSIANTLAALEDF